MNEHKVEYEGAVVTETTVVTKEYDLQSVRAEISNLEYAIDVRNKQNVLDEERLAKMIEVEAYIIESEK